MNRATPQYLDQAGIARMIPHQGPMCLLDTLESWTPSKIHCRAVSHSSRDNPLRTASGLLAPAAIEYAGQAMALHGALVAPSDSGPQPGYLASVRSVRLLEPGLDDVSGALHIRAERLAGDARSMSYHFEVSDDRGRVLVDGRATVVLNAPI